MVEINELRAQYVNLYRCMLNYSWDFYTINLLADLEVELYTSFPDISKLNHILSMLRMGISKAYISDKDLQRSFDKIQDTLNSADEVFVKLDKVQEVMQR